jgi:hypothetical protein
MLPYSQLMDLTASFFIDNTLVNSVAQTMDLGATGANNYSFVSTNFDNLQTLKARFELNDSTQTTTTTTTTAAPTTTTTTAGVTYDYYYADQYDCATCSFQQSNFIVAFLAGTVVSLNKWYGAADPDGNSYYITGTSVSGPGLIMFASEFNSCAFACIV